MLETREVLYIHCGRGVGRSSIVSACLLAHLYGLSATDALSRVQLYHGCRDDGFFTAPVLLQQRLRVYRLLMEWPRAPQQPPLFVEGTLERERSNQVMRYVDGELVYVDADELGMDDSDEDALQAAINDDLMQDEAAYMEELNNTSSGGAALPVHAGAMSMNMDHFMQHLNDE